MAERVVLLLLTLRKIVKMLPPDARF